jgi:tetratricopeptide (TPR) repeat protein
MIVATCLVGPGTEHIIGDAIKSIELLVDQIALIGDKVPEEAWVCPKKSVYFYLKWPENFAAARNYALTVANEMGADWALMLDTDERLIIYDPVPTWPEADSILCYDKNRTYARERLIRIPAKGKWVGATHEAFVLDPGATRAVYGGWRIDELPKTPEQLKRKFERDKVALETMTKENPADVRWWFYQGETEKYLGDYLDAFESFACAGTLSNWDEERAWSRYRQAEIYALGKDYPESIERCLWAQEEHPGFAEAAWLAGWCSYQLGRYQHAVYWARMAKAFAGAEREPQLARIGFRYLPAYHDAPMDLELWAWKRLNEP